MLHTFMLFMTICDLKHLWHSSCPIHWWFQIWHLIVSLVNSFGEFDISPYKVIGAALGCPRGISKMAAELKSMPKSRMVYYFQSEFEVQIDAHSNDCPQHAGIRFELQTRITSVKKLQTWWICAWWLTVTNWVTGQFKQLQDSRN